MSDASKHRPKYRGAHLKDGSIDMRLNNGKNPENTEQPAPEVSLQRWEMFRRICTVTQGDPVAIREVCHLMGISDLDLYKLRIYRRRAKLRHQKT